MKNVTLIMIDELSGKEVVRTIDATNAMSSGSECWEMRGEGEQRQNLETWIDERGNEQHETLLSLKRWFFN